MISRLRMLAVSLLLTTTGCSVHAHSEWHSGSGTAPSSGAERPAHASETREPRRSPSGRDHVVRVHVSGHPQAADGSKRSNAQHPQAVHPTSTSSRVPAKTSESDRGESAGRSAASDASRGGQAAGGQQAEARAQEPSRTEEPGGSEASSQEPERAGRNGRKHESEPHEARPSKRRRVAKGQTREEAPAPDHKGGRRE